MAGPEERQAKALVSEEERRVPLYLGEGPDRRWIGTAKVSEDENGNWHVEGRLEGWRDEDNFSSPLFHGVLPKKKE